MFLAIDVGNTNIVLGVFKGDESVVEGGTGELNKMRGDEK